MGWGEPDLRYQALNMAIDYFRTAQGCSAEDVIAAADKFLAFLDPEVTE